MTSFARTSLILMATAALAAGCATSADQAGNLVAPETAASGRQGSAAPAPSGLASDEYLLGGLDTDQPCTATLADAPALSSLGIALHEVAAMTPNPEDLGLTGDEWFRTSEYADNFQFTMNSPEACEAARQYGRVTGHMQRAIPSSPDVTYAQVQVDAALFQTEAGADAWVTWFAEPPATTTAPASPASSRTVEALTGLGDRALLITTTDASSQGSIIILRSGRVVGDAYVWADLGDDPILDVREVAEKVDERISSVDQTGRPVDIVTTMTAPLPLTAWGDEFADWTWDWAGYAGGRDNATFLESASVPKQAEDLVEEYGRLAGYQATFGSPSGSGWIATGTTTYRDEASARGAMDRIVADKRNGVGDAASPAREFEVPGVPGAIGLAQEASGELVTDVYFVRGGDLARVFRVREGTTSDTDDQGLITDMATRFASRLDSLGAARGR